MFTLTTGTRQIAAVKTLDEVLTLATLRTSHVFEDLAIWRGRELVAVASAGEVLRLSPSTWSDRDNDRGQDLDQSPDDPNDVLDLDALEVEECPVAPGSWWTEENLNPVAARHRAS